MEILDHVILEVSKERIFLEEAGGWMRQMPEAKKVTLSRRLVLSAR